MPEIIRFSNCKICVYSGDHLPPHFHIRGPGWTAAVAIGSNLLLKGRGTKADLDEAIGWAALPANQALLAQWWRVLNERD